jgi:hypothetical protein
VVEVEGERAALKRQPVAIDDVGIAVAIRPAEARCVDRELAAVDRRVPAERPPVAVEVRGEELVCVHDRRRPAAAAVLLVETADGEDVIHVVV